MKGLTIFAIFAAVCVAGVLGVPPKCPPFDPEANVVIFPNADDCSTFYICDQSNIPVLQHCSVGLWFNPELSVCDFPENIEEGLCIAPEYTTGVEMLTTEEILTTWA